MPPRHGDRVQTTAGLVHPCRACVARLSGVRVLAEELVEDDLFAEGTAQREDVPHDRPLWFTEQAQDLPEVVHERCEHQPLRRLSHTRSLSGLQGVIELA